MAKAGTKFSIIPIIIVSGLLFSILSTTTSNGSLINSSISAESKKQVTLTAILAEPKNRWDTLLNDALQKLNERHPDIDIHLKNIVLPYNSTRERILTAISNQTPIDLISLDQIWLGDVAERGYLTDLTNYVKSWGRASDWYPTNFDGGIYKGRIYGIWAWTDVRGIWYWKDLLNKAGVDPNSLNTWDGYIQSAKKLNSVLRPKGIEGIHLVGANHSPDMWYPYLWMLGGDILVQKDGHPTKGTYWFPAYNSSAGVKALQFLKEQVDVGIKPQKNHFWGQEFADRKFAVMIEGPWLLGYFPREQWKSLEQQIGFISAFPIPDKTNQSATMMGGWELSVPKTSQNKDLAWELISIMVDPSIIAPMIKQYGYIPTQKSIGEGVYSSQLNQTIPYYDQMVSMISIGRSRPSTPEYPQIADHIKQAIDEVYYGIKEPKQALDDAAKKSAKVLGW
jgi:multiple sugar transport system substrate-binding protein